MTALLYTGFVTSAHLMPERAALHVAGETLSYHEVHVRALRLAATIQAQARNSVDETPLTAVFADRSAIRFTGILGALLAGHGYVPLNPTIPAARTRRMLQRSAARVLIADSAGLAQLDEILGDAQPMLVLAPEADDVSPLRARWPNHAFVSSDELTSDMAWAPRRQSTHAVAYLLFTSGSTGEPKGVPVTHRNATHFVDTVVDRYGITPDDRLSQMFDTTFDLSVFDLFAAWQRGACVYCPSRATLLNPDTFVREHALTIWFSVPSLSLLMQRLGALKPGRYPSLRWSLFCGEPLPVSLVEAWSAAAPGSTIENLYGPTELTVACAAYRWNQNTSAAEARDGIVPIGQPLRGMHARVVNGAMRDVAPGEVGELIMRGPQRTPGYWRDEHATARSHVCLRGSGDPFYRTGDLVRSGVADGPMTYVGRVDHQIKIFGHRVELGEIEAILRQEPGVESAVAFGWPMGSAGPRGIAAFVTGRGIDAAAVRANLRKKLQAFAVPQTLEVLSEFPHNASGKVDRQELFRRLRP